MWNPLWHRGILSLVLMLGTACALILAPDSVNTPLRIGLRDAVSPGARLTVWLKSWGRDQSAAAERAIAGIAGHKSMPDDDRIAQLVEQRDAAIAGERQLTVQLAAIRRELESLRELEGQYLTRQATSPLVQTSTVTARVIDGNSSGPTSQGNRLIDAGESAGLTAGDLLVDHTENKSLHQDWLLIDQGRSEDFAVDAPVTARGALVGRVRNCGAWTSTVQRLSDPEFRVGARLVRQTEDGPVFGAVGVFAGRGDLPGELTLVPSTEPVAVGDLVYTQESVAGQELLLFIGTVTQADVAEGAPHWTIHVAPESVGPISRVDVLKVELNPQRLTSSQPGEPSRGPFQ